MFTEMKNLIPATRRNISSATANESFIVVEQVGIVCRIVIRK
jgi:hypothetical protein